MNKNKFVKVLMSSVVFTLILVISVSATNNVLPKDTSNMNIFEIKKSDLDFKKTISAYGVKPSKSYNLYGDKEDNEFIFNDEGKLVGYNKNKISNLDGSKLSETLIKEKSFKDLTYSNIINPNDDYNKEVNYIKETKSNNITYHKLCNGYKTSDFVAISYSETGKILSYASPNLGSFDNVTIPSFNEEDYIVLLENDINKINNIKDYKIEDKMLTLEDNKLKILFKVAITFSDDTMTGLSYSYEIK